MKKSIIYIFCSLTVLLSGCFKEYEERYLFSDNRLEFEDAVTNNNASGKSFPILGPFAAEEGKVTLRVNMTGKQADHDRVVEFRVVPEESTAVEGVDFALPNGREFVIPANSSFGYIEVEFLTTGSGSPTIVLELLPRDDMKVLDRYHRLGVRFLYMLTRPDPSKLQEINDIKVYTDLTIGAQLNQNIGFLADLNTFNVYTAPGADVNQESIDVMLLNGSTTGLNMLVPSSSGVTAFGSSSHIASQWTQRNTGTLMRISNPETADLNMFTNANSVTSLLSAYSYFAATIATRSGYSSTNDGPSERLRHLAPGDIVIYYSMERETVTMFRLKETVASNTGHIIADVKTGKFNPADILVSQNLTIETATGNLTSARGLINLADVTTYGFGEAMTTATRQATDFGYTWSTATGTDYGNFIAMNGSFTGWSTIEHSSAGTGVLNAWSTAERNPGEFIHFDNPTTQQVQAVSRIVNRDHLVAAYEQARTDILNVPGYDPGFNGPAARVRRMVPGSILYFKSNSAGRDLYAVIIVSSLSTSSTTNRRMELLIKSDLR